MAGKRNLNWMEMAARAVDAPALAFVRLRERFGKRRQRGVLRQAQMVLTTSESHGSFRDMAFTFAIIALAARLARADGQTTRDEFLTFREVFPMPASEHEKIHHLFHLALRDDAPLSDHARRIAALFPPVRHRALLRDVLARLVRVAAADGAVNAQEEALLREVAQCFHIGQRVFRRLLREQGEAGELVVNPYVLLGVRAGAPEADVRRAYHRLMREYHPDRVLSGGGSAEAVEVAGRQVAQLNAAYHAICSERRA